MHINFGTISNHIRKLCQEIDVIPINDDLQILTIAAKNASLFRDSQLGLAVHRQINTHICSAMRFNELQQTFIDKKSQHALLSYQNASVKQLIDQLLTAALNQRASDIHFEPDINEYRVRFRIAMKPDPDLALQISARLKVMASLDIAEKRLPQDGQLVFTHDKNYVMRMSTLPVSHGEKIVLRIIKQIDQLIDINSLGFSQQELLQYKNTLDMSQGLILVCGPTGSGKTVTLYSGLYQINLDQRNVCCVEDPIEIPIIGANQCQINNKSNLTFATILRAFLRQDPDVIMVGEIRDKETAQIAIQAAHTGHLVLSTLHTNSSCETIIRLNQMGIDNYLLASGLKLIISQRLLRLLCPHCKTLSVNHISTKHTHRKNEFPHYEPRGCKKCIAGYYGRTAIYECLAISPAIEELLFSNKQIPISKLMGLAQTQGMIPLYQAGIQLVKQGITSFAELIRVTNKIITEEK